ncbi:histidine phosphatase family protein [uncultured Lamprocystis sp.]|uniref:histidine phosphatase family protein n=1 Tax=uncultured Lamprocystis sp. TaxID=543132 RepID=UPI0025CEF643|nr:histidine phosphatase family protein [uncultured Lamprocystis sp.]
MSIPADRFIVLLRHGEVLGGARFRGGHDDALSDAGWVQLRAAVRGEVDLGHIVSSPSRRCADFAAALAVERGVSMEIAPAVAERHFGDWEGLAAHQIPAVELTRFWDDPVGYTPPGAEPFADFRTRVLAGWRALTAGGPTHTLVLTHGGAVRIILAEVLGMGDCSGMLIEVPLASLSRLRIPVSPGRPSVMAHGVIDR